MLQQYRINKALQASSQRISSVNYLYVLVLIIYGGRANTFVQSKSIGIEQITSILLPIIFSIILTIRWKVKFNSKFFSLIFGLIIYFLAVSLKYQHFYPTVFLNYFILFFVVYATVKSLRFSLFNIYEYFLVRLAIISLIMWVFQIILGGDTLFNLFSKISGISSFSYVSGDGLNAILYSVQPSEYNLINNLGIAIPRNCGYAWEPGAFAVYLCLAIFINLFISKSENKSKIYFWILIAALISTQSTTGFAMFTIIILFYYYNKNLNIKLLLLPVLITALVILFSLPFMGEKILNLGNDTDEIDTVIESSINNEDEGSVSPQRFVSFMIAFEDFKNNPILGTGGIEGESWTSKAGANISVISGIGSLLAQAGIIGFLFFIIFSIKSSYLLSEHFNYNGKFLLLIIIIFVSISYSIILLPLIACFWMFSLVEFPNYPCTSHERK